jgi:hypothetical protein
MKLGTKCDQIGRRGAQRLIELAQLDVNDKWNHYSRTAKMTPLTKQSKTGRNSSEIQVVKLNI